MIQACKETSLIGSKAEVEGGGHLCTIMTPIVTIMMKFSVIERYRILNDAYFQADDFYLIVTSPDSFIEETIKKK